MKNWKRKKAPFEEKYIYYDDKNTYAIFFKSSKIIYYNLNFTGKTKLYFFVNENADSAVFEKAKM